MRWTEANHKTSSIFFITTYFSDYILVPLRSRSTVISALLDRGFRVIHDEQHAWSPTTLHHRSASSHSIPPSTPPPTSVSELQRRTFATLGRNGITPLVHHDLPLMHCAGHSSASHALALRVGITTLLVHPPRFLSLTMTATESPALLIQRESFGIFPPDVLLGNRETILIPITLDLNPLPFEASGIVCGVAGRLVGTGGPMGMEMSYLSTARAGVVMVEEDQVAGAVKALEGERRPVDIPIR
jgi:hypothetical protein